MADNTEETIDPREFFAALVDYKEELFKKASPFLLADIKEILDTYLGELPTPQIIDEIKEKIWGMLMKYFVLQNFEQK